MSEIEIGIEEARKQLGPLVNAAHDGTDVILTRNGKPAARLIAWEPKVTVYTTTTCGAEFSGEVQSAGIGQYIHEGDYSDRQREMLHEAMLAALRDEVDARLPEDMTWQPGPSEFLFPVDTELPTRDEMAEIFDDAWAAVEAKLPSIEAKAIGDL